LARVVHRLPAQRKNEKTLGGSTVKTAYIRYYLAMLYLMNLDVARHAFDPSLSMDARALCGIGMAIGLVNLWIALRLDAVAAEAPEVPGQVVKANVGFSALWNVSLVIAGNAQPLHFAAALAAGTVALWSVNALRAPARPQLAAA
jgi:hypothetical protein